MLKSSRKNLRYPLNLKGTKSSSISTQTSQRRFDRLPLLSVKENLKSLKVTWKKQTPILKNATNLSDWRTSPPLAGIWSTSIYRTNWQAVQRTRNPFVVQSKEPFANAKSVSNREGSLQASRFSLLPPIRHLLAIVNRGSGPTLVPSLLAKQSPATSASRVVNKAIGGLSAVAFHNSVLQVLVYQMLVCLQVLEVNRSLPANLSNKLSVCFISHT